MTAVSNSFSAGNTIVAADLNTNFNELVSLVTSVGNDQLSGSITWDKLSDNHAVSWSNFTLLPYSGSVSTNLRYSTQVDIELPMAYTTLLKFQPVMKPGVDGFLCAITVYANTVTADTTYPGIRVGLNGTSNIVGQAIELDTDAQLYTLANSDPVTNPLVTLSDGDYLEVQMGDFNTTNNPLAGGVTISFAMKYRLVGG